MEIERSISAAVQKGIEGKSGITYFSYTDKFKEIFTKEGGENLEGILTSFYTCPEVDELYPFYKTNPTNPFALPTDLDELNSLEDGVIKEIAPKTFGYYPIVLNGEKCVIFQYGKFMGCDWTNSRYSNMYNSAVVCSINDIDKYPFQYCDSPIVCCDIKRSYFYPKGEAPEPSLLPYPDGLEAKFDKLAIPHTAGFEKITESELMEFISDTDYGRLDILMSMIEAIIRLKTGDTSCRIIIGDQKDNILYWIAALTYVFPAELAKDISFTTFTDNLGTPVDIIGVYIPELNGCKEYKNVANYSFENLKEDYSIYDYKQYYFAPNIEVDKSKKFNNMIDVAFTMDISYLNGYKEYISTKTNYRSINNDYYAGYLLYSIDKLGKVLSQEEIIQAFEFAKKYMKSENVEAFLKSMLIRFLEFSAQEKGYFFDGLSDYISFCLNNKLVENTLIDETLMPEVYGSFDEGYDEYISKGSTVEQLCKFGDDAIEVMFAEHFGFDGMLKMVDKYDGKRTAYLLTVVCSYVNAGKASLKIEKEYREKHNPYSYLVINLLSRLIKTDEVNRMTESLLLNGFNHLVDEEEKFNYLVCFYFMAKNLNFQNLQNYVYGKLIEFFDNDEQSLTKRNIFVNRCYLSNIATETFPRLINYYYNTNDFDKMNKGYRLIYKNYPNEFSSYYNDMINNLLFMMEKSSQGKTLEYIQIQNGIKLVKKLGYRDFDKLTGILSEYIDLLLINFREFKLPSDSKEKIVEFLKWINNVQGSKLLPVRIEIVNCFIMVYEYEYNIENKIKIDKTETRPIRFDNLTITQRELFEDTIIRLYAEYWLKVGKVPPHFSTVISTNSMYYKDFLVSATPKFVEFFCRIEESKAKMRFIANSVELTSFYKLQESLTDIPNCVFKEKIKISKLIKQLEADAEDIVKDKNDSEWKSNLDLQYLRRMIEAMRKKQEEAEKGNNVFANLFGKYKKN